MFLSLIFTVLSFSTNALAHCPNHFTLNNQSLCADFVWKVSNVDRGEPLMSPVLNSSAALPFDIHHSNFWLQIWENGDTTHKLLFPEGLEIKPFMLMLEEPNHFGFSENTIDLENGYGLKINFVKMNGCWTISLKTDELFHVIKIDGDLYTNLDTNEAFEQMSICSICSAEDLPVPDVDHTGQHNH